MNTEQFVREITALKPTIEEFITANYLDELMERIMKQFEITKRADAVYNNPILTLIKNYDTIFLDINDITFGDEYIQEDETYFFFGWDVLPNRLAIFKANGHIVSYYSYGESITFQCAESAEKFLDALVEIMKFSKEKMLNSYDELTLDKRSKEVAYIAALKAGGEEYEDYYKAVLGVE